MNQNKQGGGGNIIPWLLGGLLRINKLMSVKLSSKSEVKKWNATGVSISPTAPHAKLNKRPNTEQSVSGVYLFYYDNNSKKIKERFVKKTKKKFSNLLIWHLKCSTVSSSLSSSIHDYDHLPTLYFKY